MNNMKLLSLITNAIISIVGISVSIIIATQNNRHQSKENNKEFNEKLHIEKSTLLFENLDIEIDKFQRLEHHLKLYSEFTGVPMKYSDSLFNEIKEIFQNPNLKRINKIRELSYYYSDLFRPSENLIKDFDMFRNLLSTNLNKNPNTIPKFLKNTLKIEQDLEIVYDGLSETIRKDVIQIGKYQNK